jgi:hypothetical protein
MHKTLPNPLLSGLAFLLPVLALSASCDDSARGPDVYLDGETGQWVVDNPRTGRTWLRCPLGQEWDDAVEHCSGQAGLFCYAEAQGACPEGFSWPEDGDFGTVLCDPIDISGCDAQYGACSDCDLCRLMFQTDTGRYVSASSGGTSGGVTVYDFGTGCANWGADPEATNTNVRCVKD